MDNLRMEIRVESSRYTPKTQIKVIVTLMVPKGSRASLHFVQRDRYSCTTTLFLQVTEPDEGRLQLNTEKLELEWESGFAGYKVEACRHVEIIDETGKILRLGSAPRRPGW